MASRSRSVIIIDADIVAARRLDRSLSDRGYTVVGCAHSLTQALHLASALRPDLALVDLALCEASDGPWLPGKLRRFGIRVAFTSVDPCVSMSGSPVLSKSPDAAELDTVLKAFAYAAGNTT